jgi:DnaJ-class molecular chaperone
MQNELVRMVDVNMCPRCRGAGRIDNFTANKTWIGRCDLCNGKGYTVPPQPQSRADWESRGRRPGR